MERYVCKMFYETELKDYIRVPPDKFNISTDESVFEVLRESYKGFVSKDFGLIIDISEITDIGEGIIIAGDGAAYYDTKFKVLCLKPEIQELVVGKIREITDFGAFINMGPIDGMIHVSQTMDDFVSFSKSGVLTGKESKRSLKTGDSCRARVVAVSYKDIYNPKIGLTMRQPWLGTLGYIESEIKRIEKDSKKK